MTNQNFSTTPTAAVPLPVPTACGHCGVEERRFLHHIRHRGIFRRLCTTCVLRLNPQSFCPTCLFVYPNAQPPPPSSPGLVSCNKCSSFTHSSCVGPTFNNPNHPYICPLCVTINSPVFNLKKLKDDDSRVVIDKKSAKVLLTAAKIAAVTMSKAALAARAEAERRAKEAAFTRKRAREALEHVDYLMARDKVLKKAMPLQNGGPVSNNNRGISNNNQSLSMVVAAVPLEEENNVGDYNIVDTKLVDGSSEVLVAFNAVHLKGQNPVLGLPADVNGGSAMDVEANGGAMVSPVSAGAEDEKPVQREMEDYGIVSVQEQDQHVGNSEANGIHPKQ